MNAKCRLCGSDVEGSDGFLCPKCLKAHKENEREVIDIPPQ